MARKKPTEYKIQSVLLCDDVRKEDNGKEILIGVYNRAAIYEGFPAGMVQMFVYLQVQMLSERADEFTFQILNQAGNVRASAHSAFPEIAPNENTIMRFKTSNMVFVEPTELQIRFGIDREPETIATLAIRLAATEEERARLKATQGA